MENDGLPLYPQRQLKHEPTMVPMAPPQPSVLGPQPQPLPVQQQAVLGPENTITTCQFCKASIKTAIKHTTTSRTHIAAALWCLTCCLCCIPYSSDSCKNTDHYCANCNRYLGTYQK